MTEAALTSPQYAQAGKSIPWLFGVSGLSVALASAYQLVIGCKACQQSVTGMPGGLAAALSSLGICFGVALLWAASPWKPLTANRFQVCASLLLGAMALGASLLLGIVAGVYRPCPLCVFIWTSVAISCLGLIGTGAREGRLMCAALAVFTLAAGWTRFDRTTAFNLAAFMPKADLSSGCISDVLTKEDLRALEKLGLAENIPVFFVAHCSPCASATVKRMLEKFPDSQVVAAEETLSTFIGRSHLIVYSPLSVRASKLGANVYRVMIQKGEITECKSNVAATD